MEEMRRAVEEEERVVEEAWKVVVELGSWEERIWALQAEAEVETMVGAAKSGSSNPGPCYHCRSQKRDCVWPR